MTRTLSFVTLAFALAGCSHYHSRAQGPFNRPAKEPPPPYGALSSPNLPHPKGNQSPLGIADATPNPLPASVDPPLIPPKKPKADGVEPAKKVDPLPADDASASALPPFRKKPPAPLPSPFVPPMMPLPEPPKADPPGAPKDKPPKADPDAAVKEAKDKKNLAELKALATASSDAWKKIDMYEVTITRREVSAKGHVNNETVLFQMRREPMSVFTLTTSAQGKGRELIYNPGKFGDKLYIMVGEGDSKLVKAGFVAPPLSPDDPKVADKARYSIREAGYGRAIGVLSAAVAKLEAGKLAADALTFDGEVKRDEFTFPVVGVTHKLKPNEDPVMPLGGTRLYFFDMRKDSAAYGMPVLVIATDPHDREQEYYLSEKFKLVKLTDADFDPARLGKK